MLASMLGRELAFLSLHHLPLAPDMLPLLATRVCMQTLLSPKDGWVDPAASIAPHARACWDALASGRPMLSRDRHRALVNLGVALVLGWRDRALDAVFWSTVDRVELAATDPHDQRRIEFLAPLLPPTDSTERALLTRALGDDGTDAATVAKTLGASSATPTASASVRPLYERLYAKSGGEGVGTGAGTSGAGAGRGHACLGTGMSGPGAVGGAGVASDLAAALRDARRCFRTASEQTLTELGQPLDETDNVGTFIVRAGSTGGPRAPFRPASTDGLWTEADGRLVALHNTAVVDALLADDGGTGPRAHARAFGARSRAMFDALLTAANRVGDVMCGAAARHALCYRAGVARAMYGLQFATLDSVSLRRHLLDWLCDTRRLSPRHCMTTTSAADAGCMPAMLMLAMHRLGANTAGPDRDQVAAARSAVQRALGAGLPVPAQVLARLRVHELLAVDPDAAGEDLLRAATEAEQDPRAVSRVPDDLAWIMGRLMDARPERGRDPHEPVGSDSESDANSDVESEEPSSAVPSAEVAEPPLVQLAHLRMATAHAACLARHASASPYARRTLRLVLGNDPWLTAERAARILLVAPGTGARVAHVKLEEGDADRVIGALAHLPALSTLALRECRWTHDAWRAAFGGATGAAPGLAALRDLRIHRWDDTSEAAPSAMARVPTLAPVAASRSTIDTSASDGAADSAPDATVGKSRKRAAPGRDPPAACRAQRDRAAFSSSASDRAATDAWLGLEGGPWGWLHHWLARSECLAAAAPERLELRCRESSLWFRLPLALAANRSLVRVLLRHDASAGNALFSNTMDALAAHPTLEALTLEIVRPSGACSQHLLWVYAEADRLLIAQLAAAPALAQLAIEYDEQPPTHPDSAMQGQRLSKMSDENASATRGHSLSEGYACDFPATGSQRTFGSQRTSSSRNLAATATPVAARFAASKCVLQSVSVQRGTSTYQQIGALLARFSVPSLTCLWLPHLGSASAVSALEPLLAAHDCALSTLQLGTFDPLSALNLLAALANNRSLAQLTFAVEGPFSIAVLRGFATLPAIERLDIARRGVYARYASRDPVERKDFDAFAQWTRAQTRVAPGLNGFADRADESAPWFDTVAEARLIHRVQRRREAAWASVAILVAAWRAATGSSLVALRHSCAPLVPGVLRCARMRPRCGGAAYPGGLDAGQFFGTLFARQHLDPVRQ